MRVVLWLLLAAAVAAVAWLVFQLVIALITRD
jgi:hypothetical protein